jgi:hypothetical protein
VFWLPTKQASLIFLLTLVVALALPALASAQSGCSFIISRIDYPPSISPGESAMVVTHSSFTCLSIGQVSHTVRVSLIDAMSQNVLSSNSSFISYMVSFYHGPVRVTLSNNVSTQVVGDWQLTVSARLLEGQYRPIATLNRNITINVLAPPQPTTIQTTTTTKFQSSISTETTTVLNPTTVTVTSTQTVGFLASEGQLYGGLAVIFTGVLLVATLFLLRQKRNKKSVHLRAVTA